MQLIYTVDDVLADSCFIARTQLATILERLRGKKNLILRGLSSTGKTWLAKRLAFTLIEQRDAGRVCSIPVSSEPGVRGLCAWLGAQWTTANSRWWMGLWWI